MADENQNETENQETESQDEGDNAEQGNTQEPEQTATRDANFLKEVPVYELDRSAHINRLLHEHNAITLRLVNNENSQRVIVVSKAE